MSHITIQNGVVVHSCAHGIQNRPGKRHVWQMEYALYNYVVMADPIALFIATRSMLQAR